MHFLQLSFTNSLLPVIGIGFAASSNLTLYLMSRATGLLGFVKASANLLTNLCVVAVKALPASSLILGS